MMSEEQIQLWETTLQGTIDRLLAEADWLQRIREEGSYAAVEQAVGEEDIEGERFWRLKRIQDAIVACWEIEDHIRDEVARLVPSETQTVTGDVRHLLAEMSVR